MDNKRLKLTDLKEDDYVFSESLRQHYKIVKVYQGYALAKKWNYLWNATSIHNRSKWHNTEIQLDKNEIDNNFFHYSKAEFILTSNN